MSSTSTCGAEVFASADILATAAAILTVVVRGGAPFEWRQRGRIEGFSKTGEEQKKPFRYETKILKCHSQSTLQCYERMVYWLVTKEPSLRKVTCLNEEL